jgi:exosome complex component RRP4
MSRIVLPGELIGKREGRKLGIGIYEERGRVYAKVLGLLRENENEISVIPLSGVYQPRVGDRVIGRVVKVEISGWLVDFNSPYIAFMPLSEAVEEYVDIGRTDISRYFDVDDLIFCKISKVTKNKTVQVNMLDPYARKFIGGSVIKVTPSKIPRIIGRGGSMIKLIKEKTKTEIYTGQNGIIWLKGGNIAKAVEVIKKVERESHTSGLTQKIEKILGG